MRLPRPCSSLRLAALFLALAGLPACGRQALGPGVNSPSLTPADSNRDRLVGHVLVPSLARTYATVDALRGQGALPFGSSELRSMLAARLNIPVEVLDAVDTTQPMTLALVTRASPPPGDPGMVAGACTLRPAEAATAAAVLGAPASSQKDAQEFRRPDGGSLWVLRSGLTFIWADTLEALGEAGAHAAAARGEAADDIVVRAYPPALARWQGADPASGVQGLKGKLLQDYDRSFRERDRPAPPAAERAAYEALLDFVLAPLPDTNQLDFTIGLGQARGARLGLRAIPRPLSAFANRLATPTPVVHQPALLEGTGHVGLAGIGPNSALLDLFQSLLDAQARAGVTGAAAIAARLRALAAQLTGAMVTAARAAGNGTSVQDTVLPLRPGASPAAALDALVALARDPALGPLLQAAYGSQAPEVTAARENTDAGPGARIQLAFPRDARARGPAAIARSFYGNSTVVFLVAATGDRLLIASDPGARDRLKRLAGAGTAAAPDPALATALEDGRGHDGFLYLDLWGLVRPMAAAFVSGSQARMIEGLLALPGLAQLNLPIWANHRGGQQLEIELRVPVATMTSAASAIGLFGQASGLGMAP
jgi:hypothetical protein